MRVSNGPSKSVRITNVRKRSPFQQRVWEWRCPACQEYRTLKTKDTRQHPTYVRLCRDCFAKGFYIEERDPAAIGRSIYHPSEAPVGVPFLDYCVRVEEADEKIFEKQHALQVALDEVDDAAILRLVKADRKLFLRSLDGMRLLMRDGLNWQDIDLVLPDMSIGLTCIGEQSPDRVAYLPRSKRQW